MHAGMTEAAKAKEVTHAISRATMGTISCACIYLVDLERRPQIPHQSKHAAALIE